MSSDSSYLKQANLPCISQKLRNLRENHGHTQKQIAHVLGVSFQQIQKYETGKNRLPIEKLYILKHFYDVPFDTFFDTDTPHQTRFENDSVLEHIFNRLKALHDSRQKTKICRVIEIMLQDKPA